MLTDGERAVEALVACHREAQGLLINESLREIARRGAREAERKALVDA